MSARHRIESEASQRYLAEQLANGCEESPEQLVAAWRVQQSSALAGGNAAHGRVESSQPASSTARESDLGRRLREIRERYIAEGGKLLSVEEIDREIAERRRERSSLD